MENQQEEGEILDRFLLRSNSFCLAKVEPVFIGFTPSTSPNESVHSLIKKVQPSEKDFSLALKNTLAVAMRLLERCHRFDLDIIPY